MLVCPLCGREFKSLSSHVLYKHGLCVDEFRIQFPNQILVSDCVKKQASETCKSSGCGKWRKGMKNTEEQNRKLSDRNKGEGNPFFGQKHTEETRQKMCVPRPSMTGDKNPYKIAMQDEDFRKRDRIIRDASWERRRQDVETYNAFCEDRSRITAQAHIDGKILSYGRGHKNGMFSSAKQSTELYYRSSYELLFLELCESCPIVTSFNGVNFTIKYTDEEGKFRRYIPDFIVNESVLVEIKASFALELPKTKLKAEAAQNWCSAHGWRYELISDVDKEFNNFVGKLVS